MYSEEYESLLTSSKNIIAGTHVPGSRTCTGNDTEEENRLSQIHEMRVSDVRTADWSLPPSAVEWLRSGQETDENHCSSQSIPTGDSNSYLFQRISMEIDVMKESIYNIIVKGNGQEVTLDGLCEGGQWQVTDQPSPGEEEHCSVVPSSQNTSSGYEEDIRGEQSICSEM